MFSSLAIAASWLVAVPTAASLPLALEIDPPQVLSGSDRSVTVRVSVAAKPGGRGVVPGRDFVLQTDIGELGSPVAADDGTWLSQWRLPNDLSPRRTAVGVVDCRNGEAAFATLGVSRKAEFVTRSKAAAEIRVVLDAHVVASGMTAADALVTLNVVVPPAAKSAKVEHRLDGAVIQEETMQLGHGDRLRVWALACAAQRFGDGEDGRRAPGSRLHVHAYRDSDAPLLAGTLKASVEGEVVEPRSLRPGHWWLDLPLELRGTSSLRLALRARAAGLSARKDVLLARGRMPAMRSTAWEWQVGAHAGLVGDFGALFTPALQTNLSVFPPGLRALLGGDLALDFDLGLRLSASLDTKVGSSEVIQANTFRFVPALLGASQYWRLSNSLRVSIGLGLGALVVFRSVDAAGIAGKDKRSGSEAVWLSLVKVQLSYVLGAGRLEFQGRLTRNGGRPRGWANRRVAVAALVGYSWSVSPEF